MTTEEILNSLNKVSDLLITAEAELNRPNEHVVTYSVCHNTRNAIKAMMQLYLAAHDTNIEDNLNLDQLYNLCYNLNPDFITVDIANIDCKDQEHNEYNNKYCLSIENVNCCTNVAKQMKNVIWAELRLV